MTDPKSRRARGSYLRTRVGVLASMAALVVLASCLGLTLSLSLSPGSQASAAGRAQPNILSHFACYTGTTAKPSAAATQSFSPPAAVELTNQFAPNGFFASVGPVLYHCNPTQKTVDGNVTGISNSNAHLVCFALATPEALSASQPSYTVQITNQFGSGTLTTGQPLSLCVPSWTDLTAGEAEVQPPGLDHFVCYQVTNAANMPPAPTPIDLQDQFNTATKQTVASEIGAPNMLCVPSLKSPVNPAVGSVPGTLVNLDAHLLCYPLTAVKGAHKPAGGSVVDQNQFGVGAVKIKKLSELCVPSTKAFPQPTAPSGSVVVTQLGIDPSANLPVPLEGSTFTAYTDSSHSTALGSCTTDYSGTCQITGLPAPGSLVVSNTTAPDPFHPAADQSVTFATSPGAAALTFTDTAAKPA